MFFNNVVLLVRPVILFMTNILIFSNLFSLVRSEELCSLLILFSFSFLFTWIVSLKYDQHKHPRYLRGYSSCL